MTADQRFNFATVEPADVPDLPDGFGVRHADIRGAIGAEHLAGGVIEILPGHRAWPYHWEATQEEWLIVLSGTPTVRTPDGEEDLARGDVVCFEAGPAGAHQVLNRSDTDCRLIMVSNREPVNVIVYPDSDKVGVRTPWLRSNHPAGGAVGYWEGE